LGVLVVEAAERSGSLITARLATEQGREVFAIPGSIHSPLARGCHALIRQGAKLVETANDILEELSPLAQFVAPTPAETPPDTVAANEDEAKFLELMGYDPVEPDVLVERSGLTAGAVSSMLLLMELRGLVGSCPGGRYQRTSRRPHTAARRE
ncbi:MAG: DNA-processing protein DprA, partial [Gammaproteobacteria bacterium]|nr:DNA-processing protein DprA [Gammaproteobacteria bacterium]